MSPLNAVTDASAAEEDDSYDDYDDDIDVTPPPSKKPVIAIAEMPIVRCNVGGFVSNYDFIPVNHLFVFCNRLQ